jgi:hypothetical protein
MMSHISRTFVPLLIAVAVTGPAAAQPSLRYKIEITDVRVGFLPGGGDQPDESTPVSIRDSLYKSGAWAPVYVRLTNVNRYDPDPKKDGPAVVVVETTDCDDTANRYTVPVPQFDEQEGLAGQCQVIAYVRAGGRFPEFNVSVVSADRRELAKPAQAGGGPGGRSTNGLEPNQGLYLALGSRMSGLNLGARKPSQNQVNNGQQIAAVAVAARVADLPTVWFGYNSADVVLLSTGDRDFAVSLVNDRARSAALAEWVRRGGQIVVFGTNLDVLNGAASELNALLPVEPGKAYTAPNLQVVWREGGSTQQPLANADGKPLTLAGLVARDKPARGYRVLVDAPPDVPGATPVVVQGPYGLGRVTVVGFDLDRPPVTKWASRDDFWRQLLARAGPRVPESAATNRNIIRYAGNNNEGPADKETSSLNTQLEAFEGVPVISFGWVALFILLYILVVGPLDYLFLKKVVKRLEFTWITFPTVVLAVSAAAYFTAYHLKGSELRVNKVDVVDVDQQTGRAYGKTWFAVFSPRIQKYTVGVEPAAPWVSPPDPADAATEVSWFGISREGRQALFRQTYDYAPKAAGLRGVPIQVWTTKGFQADWAAPLDKDRPVIESRLRHPPGRPGDLIGSVTSRLPVPLDDVLLIYRGEVAALGPLLPDTDKVVTAQERKKFSVLRDNPANFTVRPESGSANGATLAESLRLHLLFHEAWVGSTDPSNGGMRDLDQSWRLSDDNRDEVILVGRLAGQKGPAEDVTRGADSPTKLWLDRLPLDGGTRPELRGTLRQDTVVRVFLPLAPEK